MRTELTYFSVTGTEYVYCAVQMTLCVMYMCVLYDSQKNSEISQYAVQNLCNSRRGTRLEGNALAVVTVHSFSTQ